MHGRGMIPRCLDPICIDYIGAAAWVCHRVHQNASAESIVGITHRAFTITAIPDITNLFGHIQPTSRCIYLSYDPPLTPHQLTHLHEARRKETPYAQIVKDLKHTHTELACRLRMCGDKKKFLAELAEERRRNKENLASIAAFGSGGIHANFAIAAPRPKLPTSYYQPPAKKNGRKAKAAAPRALLPKPDSPVIAAPIQPQQAAVPMTPFDCLALAAEQAQRAQFEGAAILAGMSGMLLAPQMTYAGVRQASIAQRGSLSHILN